MLEPCAYYRGSFYTKSLSNTFYFALCGEDGSKITRVLSCRDHLIEAMVAIKEHEKYVHNATFIFDGSTGHFKKPYKFLLNVNIELVKLERIHEYEKNLGIKPTSLEKTKTAHVYVLNYDPFWEQTTVHMSFYLGMLRNHYNDCGYLLATMPCESKIIEILPKLTVTVFTGGTPLIKERENYVGIRGENFLHLYNGIQAAFNFRRNEYYPQLLKLQKIPEIKVFEYKHYQHNTGTA